MKAASIWTWIAHKASGLLEPRERAAVCGDLIELDVRGPRALGEVLGLGPAAFDERCIPAGCVAPPANTPGILGRHALPAGRLARLGATLHFHHGLLGGMLVAACATGLAQQAALDYPQWRGRDRDGAASAFAEPRPWPESLTRRWRVEVGEGYSTPITIGDAVYVFTRQGADEVMAAIDAATGATRWRTRYPAPYSPSQPAAAHGAGPKATPLFHEGRLFTLGVSGIVSAFDGPPGFDDGTSCALRGTNAITRGHSRDKRYRQAGIRGRGTAAGYEGEQSRRARTAT